MDIELVEQMEVDLISRLSGNQQASSLTCRIAVCLKQRMNLAQCHYVLRDLGKGMVAFSCPIDTDSKPHIAKAGVLKRVEASEVRQPL